MKILYVRVSTVEQNSDRQRINEKEFDLVVEDRCSGAVPFFERPGGREILSYVERNMVTSVAVWQIDRLGRNLRDIINTIDYFSKRKICIRFIAQGLTTLEADGSENPVSTMLINILGMVGELEKVQSRERQLAGIRLAKARGIYKGRKSDTKEDVLTFLTKPKNKKALEYLKKGYKGKEAAKLAGVHPNTVSKIKKLANVQWAINETASLIHS